MHLRQAAVPLVLGAALLGLAAPASTSEAATPDGGVFRVNVSTTQLSYVDPALSYDYIGWQILQATCVKLLNYPDLSGPAGTRLRPEAAAAMPRVSGNGRTFTFRVRPGYRFNTGAPVTAASFVRAIERALSPRMQSPAASFVGDIVGAQAFTKGTAKRLAGVQVRGDELTIRLSQPAPDFVSRISMQFFCAVPPDLPLDSRGVRTPPMAGPYYVASFDPRSSVLLRRNPNYAGPRRPHVDEIRYTLGADINTSFLQVKRGEADYDAGGLPPSAHTELTRSFGINRGRYFVYPANTIQYISLNTSRPLFRDVSLRKAVNFAIDRQGLLRLQGLNAGTPTDQLLPPNIPGFRDVKVYPFSPDLERARALMRGRTGKAVLYVGNDPAAKSSAILIQANLKRIGLDVEIKSYTFATQITKAGTRGEPFDMHLIGWFADYPDPYDFVNVLLHGRSIGPENNVNTSYWDDPRYNAKMDAAARLRGDARYRAYARLDADITRNAAPMVVLYNQNVREFVSERVTGYSYSTALGSLNLVRIRVR